MGWWTSTFLTARTGEWQYPGKFHPLLYHLWLMIFSISTHAHTKPVSNNKEIILHLFCVKIFMFTVLQAICEWPCWCHLIRITSLDNYRYHFGERTIRHPNHRRRYTICYSQGGFVAQFGSPSTHPCSIYTVRRTTYIHWHKQIHG